MMPSTSQAASRNLIEPFLMCPVKESFEAYLDKAIKDAAQPTSNADVSVDAFAAFTFQ
jgi:hypothetical protein